MDNENAKRVWKKVFGFKIGDRVQIQGETKILKGTIADFITLVTWKGSKGKEALCAIIDFDSRHKVDAVKGLVLRNRVIPLEDLDYES